MNHIIHTIKHLLVSHFLLLSKSLTTQPNQTSLHTLQPTKILQCAWNAGSTSASVRALKSWGKSANIDAAFIGRYLRRKGAFAAAVCGFSSEGLWKDEKK